MCSCILNKFFLYYNARVKHRKTKSLGDKKKIERMKKLKRYLKNKKTISGLFTVAGLLTIALFFGIFTILGGKRVDAAEKTCPLKVHYLDVAGDSTLIKYRDNSGVVHYGMIDAGQETDKNDPSKSAAAYFAGIAGKGATLDFVVITHAHNDHYVGLKYFENYKIHVNTMYVNAYYNDLSENGKVSLATRLESMSGAIDNIIYLHKNEVANITYSGGFSLNILGSVFDSDKNSKTTPGIVNNRSMMCTLDYDKYKYIFMGDVYNNGLKAVTKNPTYKLEYFSWNNITINLYASNIRLYLNYIAQIMGKNDLFSIEEGTIKVSIQNLFVPPSNKEIIYKIGHHGRRNSENYDAASENAMYNFISSNKNKIYCVANKAYSTTGNYPNSIPLQKQWHNQATVSNVYLIGGYKYKSEKSTTLVSVSKENLNGIGALTSTTSFGFK